MDFHDFSLIYPDEESRKRHADGQDKPISTFSPCRNWG